MNKIIYTGKLARYLLRKGFKIVDIKPMNTDPKRSVFIFESSNELINTIHNYKLNSKKIYAYDGKSTLWI